ncbi:protein unc-93 homolog A-like [Asterias amurensis]|uniref:protein unc-93 homolog A-like n=1 Tax=Asterias amurensis TaxID=7602 RepID=UPI003AB3B0AA
MGEETDPLVPVVSQRGSNPSLGLTQTLSRLHSGSAIAWKHKRNVFVLSVAFLFNFTAYAALQNLQSSLNNKSGVASLAVIYGSIIISCLFAPALIRVVGTKWTIAICVACYSVYTACNFYPEDYTLIPGGLVLGMAAAPLWTAQATYLTTSAISYADIKNEVPEVVINQFNGIFFFFFQSSQISGNLVASLVLYPYANDSSQPLRNISNCGIQSCGSSGHHGNDSDSMSGEISSPPAKTVTLLMCVYLACGLMSFLIVVFLLSKLHTPQGSFLENTKSSLVATLHLLINPYIVMLIPLFMFSGMEQAFFAGDFTKAFITCTSGVHYVGFIMMVFGISDAIFSFTLGRLEKYCGRIIIFTAGGMAHLSLILVILFVWKPGDALWDRFLIAVGWGFGDAVWQTQISSILGVIFPENQEAAFSNFRLFQAVGFCIYFAISTVSIVCVIHKMIMIGGLLLFGLALYYIVELQIRKGITY